VASRRKTFWYSDIHTKYCFEKTKFITFQNWKRRFMSNGHTPDYYRRFVQGTLRRIEHVNTWLRHNTVWDHSRSHVLIYINPLQHAALTASSLPWPKWQWQTYPLQTEDDIAAIDMMNTCLCRPNIKLHQMIRHQENFELSTMQIFNLLYKKYNYPLSSVCMIKLTGKINGNLASIFSRIQYLHSKDDIKYVSHLHSFYNRSNTPGSTAASFQTICPTLYMNYNLHVYDPISEQHKSTFCWLFM